MQKRKRRRRKKGKKQNGGGQREVQGQEQEEEDSEVLQVLKNINIFFTTTWLMNRDLDMFVRYLALSIINNL